MERSRGCIIRKNTKELRESLMSLGYRWLVKEKGTYAHWLNCVTSISYNRHKQVMEVECNECTSKLFVDMIKSICNISEQVKSFINPEQIKAIAESNEPILLLSNSRPGCILCRLDEMESWAYLDDLLP